MTSYRRQTDRVQHTRTGKLLVTTGLAENASRVGGESIEAAKEILSYFLPDDMRF